MKQIATWAIAGLVLLLGAVTAWPLGPGGVVRMAPPKGEEVVAVNVPVSLEDSIPEACKALVKVAEACKQLVEFRKSCKEVENEWGWNFCPLKGAPEIWGPVCEGAMKWMDTATDAANERAARLWALSLMRAAEARAVPSMEAAEFAEKTREACEGGNHEGPSNRREQDEQN